MADKVEKPKKKAKPKKDEKGVLAALPSTRPERIGTRRAAAKPAATTATAKPATATRSTAPKTSTATRTAAASSSTAAKKSSTAAKQSSTAAAKPSTAAKQSSTAAETASTPLSQTRPAPSEAHARPRPVSEGAPGIGAAGDRDQSSQESARPSGAELATTVFKAAGEVAHLGLAIGGHVLKRAVGRLPRP
jgi:hypothetical protein